MAKDDWEDLPLEPVKAKAPVDDWSDLPLPSTKTEAPEESSFLRSAKETGEGLLRGAEQGATLGFADELGAFLENYRMRSELERMGLDPNKLNAKAQAEKAKQEEATLQANREEYRKAQEAAPIAYGAAQIGGAVATGMATGGLGAGGGLARQSAMSALEGGLTGYGSSEAKTLEQALPEIATGTVLGGIAPAAGKYVLAPAAKMAMAPVKAGVSVAKKTLKDLGEAEIFKDIGKGFKYGEQKGTTLFSEKPAEEASQKLQSALEEGLGVVSKAKQEALEATKRADELIASKTKDAQKKIEQELASVDALEKQNKKLLQQEKQVFESGKTQDINRLNKQADKNARDLANKYSTLYRSLGSTRAKIVEELDKQGVKVDTLPFEENLRRLFGDITTDENTGRAVFSNMKNINAADTQKVGTILDSIRQYQGEIPYSKIEELKDILQKYAYGRGGLTDESKIAVKSLYDSMNESINTSLKNQGLDNVVTNLEQINKGFRTLYKAQDIGFEKLGAEELISGTGYQKFSRQVGSEQYTPQFGEQKEKLLANIQELMQSPAISAQQKQELQAVLDQATRTSRELTETEARQFTKELEQIQKPSTTVDREAITKEVMESPEMQASQQKMAQVQNVEQVFGDLLTKGTKEARLPSRALTTAEVAGADKYAAKIAELNRAKEAIKNLAPENADELIKKIDDAIEEVGFMSRTGRSVPIGDITSQATGGPRALAVKGASFAGAAKKELKDQIKQATPEGLKAAARTIRNLSSGLGKQGAKAGATTREAFAQMLDKAADNPDKIARQATMFMLLQDPKYREITEENNE